MKFHPAFLSVLLVLACVALPARAADTAEVEQLRAATAKLIDLLVEKGVLPRDRAQALLKELVPAPGAAAAAPSAAASAPAVAQAATPAASAPATVRVPYIPEFMRKELKDEVRADLQAQAEREGWAGPGAVPPWVRALTWDGDLRTRFQFDRFPAGNAPAVDIVTTNNTGVLSLLNTTEDRPRLLVRARLGLSARADDNWSANVRLTTGSTSNPLSSNQTLGNYGNRFTVAFDRADIAYRNGDEFNAVAGRFGNPWFGTDLVWANDLSFDGIAGQWRPRIGSRQRAFVTLAAMPVQEVGMSSGDKWLYGAQVGLDLSHLVGKIDGKIGLAYYDYTNVVGQVSPAGTTLLAYTAPQFAQKGNTYYNISATGGNLFGLASGYRLVNLTGSLDVPALADKHVLLSGDYVRNLGFDSNEVSARVGTYVRPRVTGYTMRMAFGDADLSRPGHWQVFAGYKYLERDAVLDAFTDSDFHLGGTDAKGYIVGGSLGLGRNTAASLRVLSADAIDGPPLAIDVLQLDLSLRF